MKICIIEISGKNVLANTKYGPINGYFITNSICERKEYEVELDFNDIVEFEDISYASPVKPSIKVENEVISFTGVVESVEDHLLFLRMEDNLLMFETVDDIRFLDYVNKVATIKTREVLMYEV